MNCLRACSYALSPKRFHGSIPACAGKPSHPHFRARPDWVYPRVCGGTQCGAVFVKVMPGLSPRVRGNLAEGADTLPKQGSIPACAGEPDIEGAGKTFVRVYPRVCGGTYARICGPDGRLGLSPRVRGNRGGRHCDPGGRGSIPACAGEPGELRSGHHQFWVYPRVCGGTVYERFDRQDAVGLSPRVRGNLCWTPHE